MVSRNGLHFISDEAYALSVYEEQQPFQSVLNLWPMPDPQKTHVIWSFSKVSDEVTSLYVVF
jgi:aspartate/methionine/tyrosine aminotransferase